MPSRGPVRRISLALVTLGFAAAVHLDWHASRPVTHHLSLGWSWHWLLAIPVGVLTALYVQRVWADRRAFAAFVATAVSAHAVTLLLRRAPASRFTDR